MAYIFVLLHETFSNKREGASQNAGSSQSPCTQVQRNACSSMAVEAVYPDFNPLISYFHQRNASKDPKAKRMSKAVASAKFIYITYFLMDFLPIACCLCLQIQAENLYVPRVMVFNAFVYIFLKQTQNLQII